MKLNIKFERYCFTFLTLCFVFIKLAAQENVVKFDQIGLEDGLSQSTVNVIVQDKQGFIWIGTQDGLNRFDGYAMTIFKVDPFDSNSISDNYIRSLLVDSNGKLWIGTLQGGLNCFNPNTSEITKFYNDSVLVTANDITCLYEDSKGKIWIGTRSKGLYSYDPVIEKTLHFEHNADVPKSLTNNTVWSVAEDNHNNLWIGTNYGLNKLSLSNNDISEADSFEQYFYKPDRSNIISGNIIHTVCVDGGGTIWTGTYGGGLMKFLLIQLGILLIVIGITTIRLMKNQFLAII